MSARDDGGPAFPVHAAWTDPGMTLRDYFAAAALTGYVAHLGARGFGAGSYINECASEAYDLADAMLAARAEGRSDDK